MDNDRQAHVIRILESMLNNELDIIDGCRQLAVLHNQGWDIVPIEFVGYDSEMDYIPATKARHLWNEEALKQMLQNNPYRESVLDSVTQLLTRLKES